MRTTSSVAAPSIGLPWKRIEPLVCSMREIARNAEAHQRVMRKHQSANDAVRTFSIADARTHKLATAEWAKVVELGKPSGLLCGEAAATALLASRAGRAAAWLPIVLLTMHWSWGIGFLTSRRKPPRV